MAQSYLSESLPKEHRRKHQLLLYSYDIIVDILKKADEYNLSSVSFEFTDKIANESGIDFDIFGELSKRHDFEISEKILTPHIFFSLLKDLSYYLYESLSCIERGKVTVAFILARKPLQDSLFYICWLLVSPKDFIEKIQYKDPKDYDISKLKGQEAYIKKCSLRLKI